MNDRCTDSTSAISAAVYGDNTWEAYSSSGLTYVMNALSKVYRSLEWKHLNIKLALIRALLTILLTCWDIVSLSSIVTPASRIFLYNTNICVLNFVGRPMCKDIIRLAY